MTAGLYQQRRARAIQIISFLQQSDRIRQTKDNNSFEMRPNERFNKNKSRLPCRNIFSFQKLFKAKYITNFSL